MNNIIEIHPVKQKVVELGIEGRSGLICHAYSEKTRKQMQDKHAGKKVAVKREKRVPEDEYEACFYKLEDGTYGFPCTAFKQSAIRAAKMIDGINMTDARQMFFILPDGRDITRGIACVRIHGEPFMRTDEVKVQQSMDLRYRPEFTEWTATLKIEYDEDNISASSIASLLSRAGMSVGVGEWRPEKSGDFGRFKLSDVAVVFDKEEAA
jgi:hypothetical protein|tara:strand:+ start:595 stop:1221 length:627 start_codon:yes stop_codon:yes gene_type:complete